MPRNLAYYTAPGSNYPAFISVNEQDDGQVEITVRSTPEADGTEGVQASVLLDPTHPIAERFLFPVLSITRHLMKNNLGALDTRTKDEVYHNLPAALRRKVIEEVEALL